MKITRCRPILMLVLLFFAAISVRAQGYDSKGEIIRKMDAAALDWNKGNLDGYMALYDTSATMMTLSGRIGLDGIRAVFVKYYFVGKMPKQQLSYNNYQLTFLGENYALLTGRFVLQANGKDLPERTGIFSLVLVHRGDGWKIMHDHSG
jgi:ketosteroid isomerase-like protein